MARRLDRDVRKRCREVAPGVLRDEGRLRNREVTDVLELVLPGGVMKKRYGRAHE